LESILQLNGTFKEHKNKYSFEQESISDI